MVVRVLPRNRILPIIASDAGAVKMATLSAGAIATIMSGGKVEKPVFQILGIKKMTNNDRYRLNISDGVQSSSFAMLATQLNHFATEGKLEKNTVIRIENSMCNFIPPDKRILIILDLTIVMAGADVGHEIGAPTVMKAPAVESKAPVSTSARPTLGSNTSSSMAASVPQPSANFPRASAQSSSSAASNVDVRPIMSITPYQNKWTIRARVTSKSNLRTWSNNRGEGKLFSIDLLDESGEIRATCFNEQCDKFYEMIELNKTYYISRCTVKPANKQYSSLKNDYEITFNRDTMVEPCTDGTGDDLPSIQFSFVSISDLTKHEKDTFVDVIGVVNRVNDVHTLMSRTQNRELKKRDVFLVDSSKAEVSLTLWSETAENFNGDSNPIVAIKGARLSDFGGRSLSLATSSTMVVNPDIDEAKRLRAWFESVGGSVTAEPITKSGNMSNVNAPWKMMGNVKTDNLGMKERADYYTVTAVVSLCKKDNCLYKACSSDGCNKKVIDQNNGMYRCEKCNKESDNFTWRLLLSIFLADCTGGQWVTCFQDSAETILEVTASQMAEIKESDEDEFHKVMDGILCKRFTFKLRSMMETFNDENRLKTTVVSAVKMNHLEHIKRILDEIKMLRQK